MLPDFLSVVVRTLSFVGVLQAAGAALFLVIFGGQLSEAEGSIRALVRYSAVSGVVLTIAHGALEAARMAGELPGMLDPSLQGMVLGSTFGAAMSERVVGALLIAFMARSERPIAAATSVLGAALVAFSFTTTGHTSVHASRWLLAPLLIAHLVIVAFWFGALAPLHLASLRESPQTAARLVDSFSVLATWLVPGIFLAGLALAFVLVPHASVLLQPYGLLLIAKIIAFALLMLLAAMNKWRFGPAMERGERQAARGFRRAVTAEALLIIGVLGVTATMTAFFSAEH